MDLWTSMVRSVGGLPDQVVWLAGVVQLGYVLLWFRGAVYAVLMGMVAGAGVGLAFAALTGVVPLDALPSFALVGGVLGLILVR